MSGVQPRGCSLIVVVDLLLTFTLTLVLVSTCLNMPLTFGENSRVHFSIHRDLLSQPTPLS